MPTAVGRPTGSPLQWHIIDSGRAAGETHMFNDREDLMAMNRGHLKDPQIRFFQWDKPIVSYGYLLDKNRVKQWAKDLGGFGIVQRPTGGGAVLHQTTDLSISILWPKRSGVLPENPRECYKVIHEKFMHALKQGRHPGAGQDPAFYVKKEGECMDPGQDHSSMTNGRFSKCFSEPVCNDVMMGEEKIIGGALRLTRNAILYQGNILLDKNSDLEMLKKLISTQLPNED